MNCVRISISNHRAEKGKIPQGDPDWREFNGSFKNVNIEPKILSILIQKGYAYTTQHNHYRKSENFICGQHLAIDIDKDHKLEDLLNDPFIKDHACFIHTTPNHTEQNPRRRVVFILDEPVYDKDIYAKYARALVYKYKLADRMCSDCARFFYGAKGCTIEWVGKTVSLETLDKELLTEDFIKSDTPEPITVEQCEIVTVDNERIERHRERLINKVRVAQNGEKYITLRDISVTLGGYVVSGYYDYYDICRRLQDAILSNANGVKDLKHAFSTIEKSVQYGMTKPLYFTNDYKNEIDQIYPPLTEHQKEQVQSIVYQAHSDGMEQKERELWFKMTGIPENILRLYNFGYLEKRIDRDTGEILGNECLTIPYKDVNNEIVNIEFRDIDTGTISYEIDNPVLFNTDYTRSDLPMVVLPDVVSAVKSYLYIAGDWNFVGLPQMRITRDTVTQDGTIVLLEPGTDATERELIKLKDHCRFLRLPLSVDDMLDCGMDAKLLSEYLRMARKL